MVDRQTLINRACADARARTQFDPRESPFYDGPELDGLSPGRKHEMRRQLRIMARNRRIGRQMATEPEVASRALLIMSAAVVGLLVLAIVLDLCRA